MLISFHNPAVDKLIIIADGDIDLVQRAIRECAGLNSNAEADLEAVVVRIVQLTEGRRKMSPRDVLIVKLGEFGVQNAIERADQILGAFKAAGYWQAPMEPTATACQVGCNAIQTNGSSAKLRRQVSRMARRIRGWNCRLFR